MTQDFVATILHTQLTVAAPDAPAQGLLWTDDHVDQGFASSPGFVAFGVPDHDGEVVVSVRCPAFFAKDDGTLWAVQTPFEVSGACVLVGTSDGGRRIPVPDGTYDLVFEARAPVRGEDADLAFVLRLHFVATTEPGFAILEQGEEIGTDRVLSTSAEPA